MANLGHNARLRTFMDNTSPIVIDVALEPKDLNQPFMRSSRNIFRWFVVLLGVFLAFELLKPPTLDYRPFSSPFTFFALLVLAVVAGIYLPYIRIIEMFRKSPALRRRRRIIIGPDGLRIESDDATGEYKWSLFWGIQETRKTFLLQQTTASATYIPKRCFHSSGDIQRFRSLLREKFTGKLRLRAD